MFFQSVHTHSRFQVFQVINELMYRPEVCSATHPRLCGGEKKPVGNEYCVNLYVCIEDHDKRLLLAHLQYNLKRILSPCQPSKFWRMNQGSVAPGFSEQAVTWNTARSDFLPTVSPLAPHPAGCPVKGFTLWKSCFKLGCNKRLKFFLYTLDVEGPEVYSCYCF